MRISKNFCDSPLNHPDQKGSVWLRSLRHVYFGPSSGGKLSVFAVLGRGGLPQSVQFTSSSSSTSTIVAGGGTTSFLEGADNSGGVTSSKVSYSLAASFPDCILRKRNRENRISMTMYTMEKWGERDVEQFIL